MEFSRDRGCPVVDRLPVALPLVLAPLVDLPAGLPWTPGGRRSFPAFDPAASGDDAFGGGAWPRQRGQSLGLPFAFLAASYECGAAKDLLNLGNLDPVGWVREAASPAWRQRSSTVSSRSRPCPISSHRSRSDSPSLTCKTDVRKRGCACTTGVKGVNHRRNNNCHYRPATCYDSGVGGDGALLRFARPEKAAQTGHQAQTEEGWLGEWAGAPFVSVTTRASEPGVERRRDAADQPLAAEASMAHTRPRTE